MRTFLRWAALLFLLLAAVLVQAQDLQRGYRNYQDVVSGRKTLEQLSPQERSEVIHVHRLLETKRGGSGKSSECRDAISEARSKASDLADYAKKLRTCAESEDYSDDCSTEFRRTRSAHGDYESAVSDVSSRCD